MPCPNCGSKDIWDDNMHWGCNICPWTSLAGLNKTRTPSAPHTLEPDPTEVERRAADWAKHDAEYEPEPHDRDGDGKIIPN